MIIPVIDLKDGIAVSGKSGMRKTYKPLQTIFHDSSDPLLIARAIKDAGFSRIYVADLDAIDGGGSNLQLVSEMNDIIPVMLDSGANNANEVEKLLFEVDKVIIATETLESYSDIDIIFSTFPTSRLVISIDFKDGNVLSRYLTLNLHDMIKKLSQINSLEVIILDISRVGTEKGVDHELIKSFLGLETKLILGGGVTNKDILELNDIGIKNFLVGTALHAGILNVKL
jgi:phosphoribosylformimino-5-aminoimidazole carboxamide ribotide isomerase